MVASALLPRRKKRPSPRPTSLMCHVDLALSGQALELNETVGVGETVAQNIRCQFYGPERPAKQAQAEPRRDVLGCSRSEKNGVITS
jgi:hypothetical protein